MAKEKKKKSVAGIIFSIIGFLILAAIVAAVAAIFIFKAKLAKQEIVIDDFSEYAVSTPAPEGEHLSFSPDAEMTFLFDKSDVCWFLDREFGSEWLDKQNETLSKYKIRLNGIGIEIKDEGIDINVEAYLSKTRIPFTVQCETGFNDESLWLEPKSVKVLNKTLPIEKIPFYGLLKTESLNWSYTPSLTYIEKISGFKTDSGKVCITGPMETQYLNQTSILGVRLRIMRAMLKNGCYIAPILENYSNDPKVCFATILPTLQDNPEVFCEMLRQYFSIRVEESVKHLWDNENNNFMMSRWFVYDWETYKSDNEAAKTDYDLAFKMMGSISEYTFEEYMAKRISVRNGELLYKNEPLTMQALYDKNYDMYNRLLDMESVRFCFSIESDEAECAFPPLSRLVDKTESLSAETDLSVHASPALLYRGEDGCAYIYVCYGGWELVDEAVFEELMSTELVPILDRR